MTNETIIVKVARAGSKAVEACLNGDTSVSRALEIAELNPKETETVMVNDEECNLDDSLENGDVVTIVRNIEGGN